MDKVVYITQQTPYGRAEAFLMSEMAEMSKLCQMTVIPLRPDKHIFHKEAVDLSSVTIRSPLVSLRYARSLAEKLFEKPYVTLFILKKIVSGSRNLITMCKNLTVLPKSTYIAEIVDKKGINHIHAHWASTPTSAAWAASKLTGVPFSFTAHRWDITTNNMLREKVASASFVRCISGKGKEELLSTVGEKYEDKVTVVHMGTKIPGSISLDRRRGDRPFTIITPANLLEVKGHKYLIAACSILNKNDTRDFRCVFCGEGPEKNRLNREIAAKSLGNRIQMLGEISHDRLLQKYKNGEVDVIVLPSITTGSGEHEGIPVSLMEAMAYGIPVISTDTGGIAELLSGDAGMLVKEKSPQQLAEAITVLMEDVKLRENLAQKGYEKVKNFFDVQTSVEALMKLMMDVKP